MQQTQLTATAFAVNSLAQHMQDMRAKASAFQEAFGTGERGYFSPSEDDAASALWVSYHKARNALLETIGSIKQDVGQASEGAIAEFTIAYASALILVDAARFLRDLFANDAIVRSKLNESYQAFGIEAGSFDVVQRSLTAPSNALQIRAANQFYDDHAEAIAHACEELPELQSIVEIIDSLSQRARVETGRYVRVRLQEHRHRLNDAIVSGGLMKAVYSIQEWGSRLVSSLSLKPSHVPQLPDHIVAELQPMLRPGDIFVTRKENAITNYFLPGYWPHVALHAGNGQVIESLKDGVRRRTLDSPFGNDAVCVIRSDFDAPKIQQALARADTHIGKPYDFDFDFTRADRMVCTEVVYRSFEGLGDLRFELSRRAGRLTLSAEDLLRLAMREERFSVVAVFCPAKSNELETDANRLSILNETVAAV